MLPPPVEGLITLFVMIGIASIYAVVVVIFLLNSCYAWWVSSPMSAVWLVRLVWCLESLFFAIIGSGIATLPLIMHHVPHNLFYVPAGCAVGGVFGFLVGRVDCRGGIPGGTALGTIAGAIVGYLILLTIVWLGWILGQDWTPIPMVVFVPIASTPVIGSITMFLLSVRRSIHE
ncbi:hypothetical protein [Bremerella sp. P1]|uniref:hypothetical protein n=1 Tax=Bremerella sp. P1 TaxID=3026424 RepID=UPI002367E50D|nr:hypothetical protein [Bremerella sp. P1]WDI42183.1 hypothetical protein PSR63_27410 [Bremerella sp. P1]